jgi:hypothetical protein
MNASAVAEAATLPAKSVVAPCARNGSPFRYARSMNAPAVAEAATLPAKSVVGPLARNGSPFRYARSNERISGSESGDASGEERGRAARPER